MTPDMAIRLSRLLGNGPEIWLRMQQTLGLRKLEREKRYNHIKPVEKAA